MILYLGLILFCRKMRKKKKNEKMKKSKAIRKETRIEELTMKKNERKHSEQQKFVKVFNYK